jgi:cytosine/adenosine deaminase-related metal-dependent hydrolase
LYDWAAAWSMKAKVPLCTHLAETEEELQLLRSGNGPLRDFLVSLGAWSNDWEPPGSSPAQWITGQQTSQASWILAHGNYLCESEIAQLAAHNKSGHFQCAIAYCPRTHNYFGHRCHPHKKIRAAGITVCLGTDSLASSPSLSILDEMRFVRRRDSSLDGPALLRMGTIAGATALRMEQDCGSLAPGKYADLAVVRLPKVEGADPYDLLLQSHEPVVRTMIGGRWAYQRR